MARRRGPGGDLRVDANSGLSVHRTITVGRLLQDQGIGHDEEPLASWEQQQRPEVTAAPDLDVTGGEPEGDMVTSSRMIDLRAVDSVQPDVRYMGGISRMMAVAQKVMAGPPCTPPADNLSLVTICTMHPMCALPDAGKYPELSIKGDERYLGPRGLFVATPYAEDASHVTLWDAAGWVGETNPDGLAHATHPRTAAEGFRASACQRLHQKLPQASFARTRAQDRMPL